MATDFLQSAFDMLSKPLTVESEQQLDLAIEQYDQDAREATYRYYPGSSDPSSGSEEDEVENNVVFKDVAISPPVVGLGPPPMPASANTELQQMLTAWYYAGYYAGLYAGKNIKDS